MIKHKMASLLRGGVKEDPKDDRDYVFSSSPSQDTGALTTSIPLKIDHSPKMSSIKFQGQLGSCVGFAAVAIKEWQETIEHEREVNEGKRDRRRGQEYNLSEQWLYRNCKRIDP